MLSPMDSEDSPGISRNRESSKRRRLNFACNYCRNRKTRCDEQQPSCQACISAGIPCVTEDRRRPGKLIKRREAGKSIDGLSVNSTSPSEYGAVSVSEEGLARRRSVIQEPQPRTITVAPGPIRPWSQSPRQSKSRDSSHTDTIINPLPVLKQSTGTTSFQIPQALFDAYEREVHTFYPVVRLEQARVEATQSQQSIVVNPAFGSVDTAALRTCLLFAAGGCILQHPERRSYMADSLSLARNALGHLIGNVSFETIEVLFLFSVCLRLNDEITSAWTTLNICLSIAHSLGLNRPARDKRKTTTSSDIHAWNPSWWALYSYEKLFSFQLGYVSSISDEAYGALDLEAPKHCKPEPRHYVLSMAQVFSRMSHRCAKARQLEDRASRRTIEAAIKDKVNGTGESFIMLSNWANSIPSGIRPTSDFIRVPEDLALSSFISLHYHNAIIMLNRNSLVISKDAIYKAVEIIAKDTPWEYSIRNGQSMVANSARKIIHLLADSDDTASHLFAPAYFPLLHALYVLAIHILKQPHSRIAKIDQSLLITAADLARCYCVGLDEADRLHTVLNGLVGVVQEAMKPAPTTGQIDHNTLLRYSDENISQRNITPLPPQQSGSGTFSQSLVPSESSILNPVDLRMDEGALNQFSGQPFNIPILPDEIGCDWADFEILLQGLENDPGLYTPEDGMNMDL
ncbi:Ff.00g108060.m01.CDS01 [Fusarium sp. VM40]|nr:Ff.00g108060.m01.CDS01 [Fusarium sp. VM40]